MSELISGKEVLIALANGKDVEACVTQRLKKDEWHWFDAKSLTVNEIEAMETDGNPDGSNILPIAFRLKPRTILINDIEVPAPFEPKDGDKYYHISIQTSLGYGWDEWESSDYDARASIFGAWRTEEEIKQVVSALRTVLGAQS